MGTTVYYLILSLHTLTLLSLPLTLLSDILLSKDKVRGVYIELKEDVAQAKEVEKSDSVTY